MDILRGRAISLRDRLMKEANRPGVSTANIGGLTKMGHELELLLRVAASIAMQSRGRNLETEIAKNRKARGAGTYLHILRDVDNPRQLPDLFLIELARDARRGQQSQLAQLVDIRNQNSHPMKGVPGGALDEATRRALRQAAEWLDRVMSGRSE